MIKQEVRVGLTEGLDVSPVALLVQIANNYESNIFVEVEGKSVNAKSIMGMMTLGLHEGEQLVIVADGADEKAAIAEIEEFLSNNKKRSEEE